MPAREPLSRERIIEAAMAVADEGGLRAVSMRNVARALEVEAMSLYHHVRSKDDLLDALVDAVFIRIQVPDPSVPWRPAMTARATSAREVLSAHPWALGLIESRRSPGPALLRHHDGVLANLMAGGFPVLLAAHAFSAIDAYVYGFVLTEQNLPIKDGADAQAMAADLEEHLRDHPHLGAVVVAQVTDGDYTYGRTEFAYGLELILDSLAVRLEQAQV